MDIVKSAWVIQIKDRYFSRFVGFGRFTVTVLSLEHAKIFDKKKDAEIIRKRLKDYGHKPILNSVSLDHD